MTHPPIVPIPDREAALREVLEGVLQKPLPPLENASALADLPGWDSVLHLELLLALERRFGLRLTAAQLVGLHTVGDLRAAVASTPQTPPSA